MKICKIFDPVQLMPAIWTCHLPLITIQQQVFSTHLATTAWILPKPTRTEVLLIKTVWAGEQAFSGSRNAYTWDPWIGDERRKKTQFLSGNHKQNNGCGWCGTHTKTLEYCCFLESWTTRVTAREGCLVPKNSSDHFVVYCITTPRY